ncbi:MAG: hypothetical protein EPO12_05555 [Aquabacterium sp.]|jgi:cell division protein FtsN|nr:MAG: hypothetical protein EPO12_05555 [Aquabacterium sp.]
MHKQRGGTVVGLIIGLLLGLGIALAVAIYVNKVPVPFVNKVPQRTAEQDAAEAAKNKNWDPNAPLYGKNPAKPHPVASAPEGAPGASEPTAASQPAGAASGGKDPAAILNGADSGVSTDPAADPFIYYVQAGAFANAEEAEQQRARLGLLGLEARISEREQAGRTVYRVRVGPFEQRASADEAKATLGGNGIDSALVRVQRRTSPASAASQ